MDKPRYLRASPHSADFDAIRRSFDDEGVPRDLHDAGADAAAAEESGYTTSQVQALAGEPEPVHEQEELEVGNTHAAPPAHDQRRDN